MKGNELMKNTRNEKTPGRILALAIVEMMAKADEETVPPAHLAPDLVRAMDEGTPEERLIALAMLRNVFGGFLEEQHTAKAAFPKGQGLDRYRQHLLACLDDPEISVNCLGLYSLQALPFDLETAWRFLAVLDDSRVMNHQDREKALMSVTTAIWLWIGENHLQDSDLREAAMAAVDKLEAAGSDVSGLRADIADNEARLASIG